MQQRDRVIKRELRSRKEELKAGILRAQGAAAATALLGTSVREQMAARAQAVADGINALPEVRAAIGQQRGAELAQRIASHRAELQLQRAATAAEARILAGPVLRGSYARVAPADVDAEMARIDAASVDDAEMARIEESARPPAPRHRATHPRDAEGRRSAAREASQAKRGGAARSSQASARDRSVTDRRDNLTRELANQTLLGAAPSPNWPAGVSVPTAQFQAASVPMASFGEPASSSTAPQFMERPGGTGEPEPASRQTTLVPTVDADNNPATSFAGPRVRAPRMPQPPQE